MSKIEFEPTDKKVGCFIYTNLKEVKTLEDTKRGSGGFGSTGTK